MVNTIHQMPRKPRLLWANPYCLLDTASGASMSVREMLLQLTQHGYEVEVVGATIFDAEKGTTRLKYHWDAITNSDKKVINVNDGPLMHRLVLTKSIARDQLTAAEESTWFLLYTQMLAEFKPDLVWFYGGKPLDLLISYEARTRGIPSAAYLVNANFQGKRWCQDVDLILTDSQATSDMYAEKDGFTPQPIGKFIDPNRVIAAQKQPQHITFINPSLAKGAGIVIQLAILLEKRRPDIKFEVVESRGNWHALVKTVTELLGEPRDELDNVIVTPNTDDMRPIYARSRLLLAPSLWWESGARVLAEAMLNGIPAIVTARGGSPEMIGRAGIKVELPASCHEKPFTNVPRSSLLTPLVERIEQLFDDEALYQQYVARAREQGKLHRIETSTGRLMKAFAPLIQQRAGDNDHKALIEKRHKHPANAAVPSQDMAEKNLLDRLKQRASPTEPLRAGEKGVFIDCGGYDGCSAIKFSLNNPSFDCVTFEPNPVLWPYYDGVPTHLVKKAAYTHNGTITFTLDNIDEDGSSLIEGKRIDFRGKVDNEKFPKIEAKCVDVADVISEYAKNYDRIVLKMDIEGAEYDILERLIEKELIGKIDKLYCEFHWHKCGISKERHNKIIREVEKAMPVLEWDALDFSVHKRKSALKNVRDALLNNFKKNGFANHTGEAVAGAEASSFGHK